MDNFNLEFFPATIQIGLPSFQIVYPVSGTTDVVLELSIGSCCKSVRVVAGMVVTFGFPGHGVVA